MNKAFLREPDRTADYCPRCGSQGEPVGGETLREFLTEPQRRLLADPANFCPSPQCTVVYFDSFEHVLLTSDLSRPVYPKDPNAPICPCFGLTAGDIERDVEEGVTTRVRAAVAQAKSPDARCRQRAANGRSCVAYVQKYYLQCLNRKR